MQRAFATLPARQVHYRQGGTGGRALLMLHASPASSRQLERLGDALASKRPVFAPDRPGNGDSPALPVAIPEIADYARAELEFLDAIGLDQVDVYGSHTGACMAVELAIRAPNRVRRVVLDGIGLFSEEEVRDYLLHYAPAMAPDLAGTHLTWAFQFCRDQALFFPWFKASTETARGLGLPAPAALHEMVVDVLKSLQTYHLGYNASFRYPARERLPLLQHKVLAIAAADDPLAKYIGETLSLLPSAVTAPLGPMRAEGAIARLAECIAAFLDR
jgi:pimeloyl-ACP methyl ester carboxylesterase